MWKDSAKGNPIPDVRGGQPLPCGPWEVPDVWAIDAVKRWFANRWLNMRGFIWVGGNGITEGPPCIFNDNRNK